MCNVMKKNGFSLLELLVSFLLSSLVMMLLMQQIVQLKRQSQLIYSTMNEVLEVQWLTDFIRHRVYKAGFTPCRSLNELTVMDARGAPDTLTSIELNQQKNGFSLHHMHEDVSEVINPLNLTTLLVTTSHFDKQHPVLIADCHHAEVHTIVDVTRHEKSSVVVLKEPLVYSYQPPIYLGEWVSEAFFIRTIPKNKSALFYRHHRVDQLSAHVNSFTTELDTIHNHFLLRLKFKFDTSRSMEIDVRGRNA